jgi:predicted RNase H-like HicB family nuclease
VDTADADANFLTTHYPENYFSPIVIDECHRSAWGKWPQVLTRNAEAVQIGLTATPRKLEVTEDASSQIARRSGSAIIEVAGGGAMKFYTFEIVIEKEPEDDGYAAYSPTLPGCFSNGKTIEEAKQNIREAIRLHIESLVAHGQPIPQNARLVHVEELTVGIP